MVDAVQCVPMRQLVIPVQYMQQALEARPIKLLSCLYSTPNGVAYIVNYTRFNCLQNSFLFQFSAIQLVVQYLHTLYSCTQEYYVDVK